MHHVQGIHCGRLEGRWFVKVDVGGVTGGNDNTPDM